MGQFKALSAFQSSAKILPREIPRTIFRPRVNLHHLFDGLKVRAGNAEMQSTVVSEHLPFTKNMTM
jgi:hypothetical protein